MGPAAVALLLVMVATSQGAGTPGSKAQGELPPPLLMHGDTLVVHPRTPGAQEMRLLVLRDTVWLIDGGRRTLASVDRARAARLAVKALSMRKADLAADSAFLARHPGLRRPKPWSADTHSRTSK